MKLTAILNFPRQDTRYPFLFLLLVALAAFATAVYFYFTGPDTVIPWETNQELHSVSMPAGRFSVLLQNLDIKVKGFLLSERFEAGLPVINYQAAFLVLGFTAISLIYYLTIISGFRQLPFFAGILLFMLFLPTFNFDLLGIFEGPNQYILVTALTILGGAAFLLQAFFTNVSFQARLFLFAFLIAGLGIFVFQFSALSTTLTALHLVNYSAPGLMLASVLFIFCVAYENIHGLLWFNTQAQNPAKRFSLWQFGLICALYLANLLLIYFKNARILKVDIVLIDAFLILVFSTLVGFWGTKRREMHYGRFFNFENSAAFLYLVFAILTACSIGYAFATANDSLIRGFTDLIVYTHLALGALFFLYILVNFGSLINQKLRVYRVVYDPKIIPFYTVYTLSAIFLVALMLRTNFYTFRKANAGYNNYLGDYYHAIPEPLLAERFYNEAHVYDNNNVKATYSLAGIYNDKAYLQAEINQLRNALLFYPNPKVYTRLANKYTEREKFFDQLFVLRSGLKAFPKSAELYNNQALVYASTAMADSVNYFFDLAQKYADKPEIMESNRLAFYLYTGLGKQARDRAQAIAEPTYAPLQSNLLYLQSFGGTPYIKNPVPFPTYKILSLTSFATVYHAAFLGQVVSDKTALSQLNNYIKAEENGSYRFDLSVAKAFVQNRLGQTLAARTTLENLAGTEEEYSGFVLDMIGLQLLRQKLYAAAATHFAQARAKGWPEANLHLLYALALQPARQTEALLEAGELAKVTDPDVARKANQLLFLLQATPTQIVTHPSDSLKVQYLQLNGTPGAISNQEFVAIASTVRAPELQPLAQKELAAIHVSNGNIASATQILQNLLPKLTQPNQLLSEVNILQAEILLKTNNSTQLQKALPRMHLEGQDQKLKYYYQALLADKLNLKQEAQKRYAQAIQVLPYHEPTVLAAATFYSQKLKQDTKAYDLLLNSITYNPYAPEVYKAYILKSIQIGYGVFAETALQELAKQISPAEMAAFQVRVAEATRQRDAFLEARQL